MHPKKTKQSTAASVRICAAVSATLITSGSALSAGTFDPALTQVSESQIVRWATGAQDLNRGLIDPAQPFLGNASQGSLSNAIGAADANRNSPPADTGTVSLGDFGSIVVTFGTPIVNGPGLDFAVFENGSDFGEFGLGLELAFVEVSSNGTDFFRFQSVADDADDIRAFGSFGSRPDATGLNNLAGNQALDETFPTINERFGTGFDLEDLVGQAGPDLDLNNITAIRIIDVGGLDPEVLATLVDAENEPIFSAAQVDALTSFDSEGNVILDSTGFSSPANGFDLDAVGAINIVPEPSVYALLFGLAALTAVLWRRRGA